MRSALPHDLSHNLIRYRNLSQRPCLQKQCQIPIGKIYQNIVVRMQISIPSLIQNDIEIRAILIQCIKTPIL